MDDADRGKPTIKVSQRGPVTGPITLAVTVNAVVSLETFTIRYALAVLDAHDGNKSRASRALGISRFTLARLVKRAAALKAA